MQSMCRIIHFKQLSSDQLMKRLIFISKNEGIPFNTKGLQTICYISYGDMRRAINNLQLTAFTYEKIIKENVLKICKIPDPEEIVKIISNATTENSNLEK